jgi:hypothetical protein
MGGPLQCVSPKRPPHDDTLSWGRSSGLILQRIPSFYAILTLNRKDHRAALLMRGSSVQETIFTNHWNRKTFMGFRIQFAVALNIRLVLQTSDPLNSHEGGK